MRNDNDDSQAASRLFNLRTSLALVLLFTPARLPVRALRRTFRLSRSAPFAISAPSDDLCFQQIAESRRSRAESK